MTVINRHINSIKNYKFTFSGANCNFLLAKTDKIFICCSNDLRFNSSWEFVANSAISSANFRILISGEIRSSTLLM